MTAHARLRFRWFWKTFGYVFGCHYCHAEVVGAFTVNGANRKLARVDGACRP